MTGAPEFRGGLLRRNGLAVLDRAAAFAFAGVLARAAAVAGFAAALAFAGVFAGAAMVGIGLLFVGEDARGGHGLAGLGRGRSTERGDEAAGEDSGDGSAGEQRFGGGLTFHGSVS